MRKSNLIAPAVILGCIMMLSGCNEKQDPTTTPVTGVELSQETLVLTEGETAGLSFSFLPESVSVDPADAVAEWSSSDETVATVDASGLVTAVAGGECTVLLTVTLDGGTFKDECSVEVEAKPVVATAFGDYYYSDGTWSSELDPGKTPIGIVFYASDPTAQDSYLKEKHPGCTHGIAVSIKEADKSAWQSSMTSYYNTVDNWVSENLIGTEAGMLPIRFTDSYGPEVENIQGFNNTEAIRLFNEANPDYECEIIDAVDAFAAENSAPENSSGWYLPSIMELTLMCTGDAYGVGGAFGTDMKVALNEKLATISGAELLADAEYNSSTEYNEMIAYTFDFNYGLCFTFDMKTSEYSNRCVIAF